MDAFLITNGIRIVKYQDVHELAENYKQYNEKLLRMLYVLCDLCLLLYAKQQGSEGA